MRTIYLFILITIILISGCAKSGELTFLNKSNHRIYYTLEGIDYILEGQESDTYSYRLGKETIFNSPSKDLKLKIYGENFALLESTNNETSVSITPDKNLKLYLWPTHACLKVVNNSMIPLRSITYEQHFPATLISSPELLPQYLNPGDSTWFRINYSEGEIGTTKHFYYRFKLININNVTTIYGDSTTVLEKDDQYRLVYE